MSEILNSIFLSSHSFQHLGNLEDIFRCIICFNTLKDPRMCPSCSKLCCQTCFLKWLTEQKPECPHCRMHLRPSSLVPCRFLSEISAALEKLQIQNADGDKCETHNTPMHYFCITCQEAICSDCAMFGSSHKNHEFSHLMNVYQKHVDNVKLEAQGLMNKHTELSQLLASVEENIENVRKGRNESLQELNLCLDNMKSRIANIFDSKMLQLKKQKSDIADEIDFIETMQIKINRQLSNYSKSTLIYKTPELISMLQEIQNKPTYTSSFIPISPDFPSEIVPSYDEGTYKIERYSILRRTTEVIYSDHLNVSGICWRLKIYPNGNGVAKGTYISIFLEMVKGTHESSKYEYRVEMVNQNNPAVCVVREFSSEFESGECWGYNKFFRIDLLEEKGYLNTDDDSVLLRYYVRAPTYCQQARDQKRYIEYLEETRNQSEALIQELREKIAQVEPEAVIEDVKQPEEMVEHNESDKENNLKPVICSHENPLVKICEGEEEEKERPINLIDETSEEMKWHHPADEEESIAKTIQRLKVLRRRERSRIRDEEVSKEESPNRVPQLNTVLSHYMMMEEDCSSSGSLSPHHTYDWDRIHSSGFHSDILGHDLLNSSSSYCSSDREEYAEREASWD